MKVQAIGIDVRKTDLHLVRGFGQTGSRRQEDAILADQTSWCLCGEPATCLVAMEACCVPRSPYSRSSFILS